MLEILKFYVSDFRIWLGITVGLSMILSIFVVNLVETIIIKKGDEDEDSSTR